VRCLFDRIFLDVGHDHIGARLGKRRRDSEADAGSGTRDDRFAGDVFHRKAPCLSWRPSADRSAEDAQVVVAGDLARLLWGEAAAQHRRDEVHPFAHQAPAGRDPRVFRRDRDRSARTHTEVR
jgi:hypothetical protein